MATPPTFDGWLKHGWGVQAKTAHQVLRLINGIALLAQGRTYAWRGQNDDSWDFSSSLYREIRSGGVGVTESAIRGLEAEILAEARKWGLGRDLGA